MYKKISKWNVDKIQQEISQYGHDKYHQQTGNDKWLGLPLKNAMGSTDQKGILIVHAMKKGGMKDCIETEYLKTMPYVKSILDSFPGQVFLVRLMKLLPGEKIKPHHDFDTFRPETGHILRFHIPIVTDPSIKMFWNVNGEEISTHLEEGWLYITNVAELHWVTNPSTVERIHLIMDVENNEATRKMIQ